jgi:hypothetical protein
MYMNYMIDHCLFDEDKIMHQRLISSLDVNHELITVQDN